jgi:hypothetical protein
VRKRILAAQSYFKPNLITVVKKRTEGQRPIRTLEDKGLVKLFYSTRQNNGQKRQSEAVNRRRTDNTMAKRDHQKL